MVNDGSTDSSGNIAKEFASKDCRFKYIEKTNAGLSHSRNVGMESASGVFLFFLDSDDWIKNDCIEIFVQSMDDDTDIVISKYTLVDTIINKNYTPFNSDNRELVFEGREKEKEIVERHINAYAGSGYIIRDTLMPVWKNFYRSALLKENKITFHSERIYGSEDYFFNFEAYYYAKKIKCVPFVSCMHVIVKNSLSRSFDFERINHHKNLFSAIEQSINEKNFYDRKSIIYALYCERCRSIVNTINKLAKSNKDTLVVLKEYMSSNFVQKTLEQRSRPNLERKYMLLYIGIRCFGGKNIYRLLKFANKYYSIYRLYEKKTRT
jgi:glycosyltransferase involved in cell wall biosynthesis